MKIQAYIEEINQQFSTGVATEHTYRLALEKLLKAKFPGGQVINEPKKIKCGAPDLMLIRKGISVGYVEAKGIGKDLDSQTHKEQLERYTKSLDNLLFTNYLEFRLIRNGKQVSVVTIGGVANEKIRSKTENFADFTDFLETFINYQGQTIAKAEELAEHMARKARMLTQIITQALNQDEEEAKQTKQIKEKDSALWSQLATFKKHLIHNLKVPAFADMYAQTITYGMFAARLHDPTPATFTRQKAAKLIPASNPFLHKFFRHIVDYDLDDRIRWIVDDLANIFRVANIGKLMKEYGKATQRNDPFMHFYETFLGQYDPDLRKKRGVYYTPEPVVNFIVHAVHDILCSEFNLRDGLADTSKTTIEIARQPPAGKQKKGSVEKYKKEIHKVQILDPATGTGTFLAAIVKRIYKVKVDTKQEGTWSSYVRDNLIPRLNGFEVLMASYAMAHIKLEMVLRDNGYKLGKEAKNRLRIFLTNSLEEHQTDAGIMLDRWLVEEANEANSIKRATPVMVVIGNPPYAVGSSNKGEWIQTLLADYKKDLNERKINLDDDYIKFIRYGEHLVEKTSEGILAYISNNSFLDGVTHRQMRKHLLETFNKIYIINLHGDSNKKETDRDGLPDGNVFDIRQGVSINLFVKTGKKNKNRLAQLFHYDLYGTRESKYNFLQENSLKQVQYKKIYTEKPYYFFVPKDFSGKIEYEKGFKVSDLCSYSAGVGTKVDHIAIDFDKNSLRKRIQNILNNRLSLSKIKDQYGLNDNTTWEYDPEDHLVFNEEKIVDYEYRPFDIRKIYFDNKFLSRSRSAIMNNFYNKKNIGIEISRNRNDIFIGKFISDEHYASSKSFKFPLYLYSQIEEQTSDEQQDLPHNFHLELIKLIANGLGLAFVSESKNNPTNTFVPIDLFDYIYAVLHSPSYRKRYQEFLEIDFPRVPYPTDKVLFRKLVKLGSELRALHLLESTILDTLITGYSKTGDDIVTKPEYRITDVKNRTGKVKINDTQYFSDVPEIAWNFYIGGYQPAQKWLKDRKTRELSSDDIEHYQKIIVALTETNRLMKEIDITRGG